MASLIYQSLQKDNADPYASNWLERLRKIKTIRLRLEEDLRKSNVGGLNDPAAEYNSSSSNAANTNLPQKKHFHVDDFTEFV